MATDSYGDLRRGEEIEKSTTTKKGKQFIHREMVKAEATHLTRRAAIGLRPNDHSVIIGRGKVQQKTIYS